jgi:Restriction endonuclease
MARTNAQIKGDALERAVQLLETFILGTNSSTREATVTIEPKKIIDDNSVKHEIDIYITVDPGNGYESVYIFECKNWEQKVGKNEIIVFSEKIDVTRATKGFFVAKSFTIDAEARAKQDKRITLLIATDELGISTSLITDFSININTDVDSYANFICRPGTTAKPPKLTNESFALYRNEHLLLRIVNERIRQQLIDETMQRAPADVFFEDVGGYKRTQSVLFQPQELVIEGCEIYQADMTVTWKTRIIRPSIVSKFNIETRGRVIMYESGEIPSVGNIQMSLVEIEKP